MAQGFTTLAFQTVSFRIYPPHSPHSLVSGTFSSASALRRRTPLSLDLMPVGPSAAAVVLASPSQKAEGEAVRVGEEGAEWGKVSAVLFDMDGVLCNSEELSRLAAVDVFADMGVSVTTDDFIPFMGTGRLLLFPVDLSRRKFVGEANFLGGVARVKGVKGFDPEAAKKRFFEIYLAKYAKPEAGIGFPGGLELITECKRRGLKVAVASSADRIKVDANLAAAGLPVSLSVALEFFVYFVGCDDLDYLIHYDVGSVLPRVSLHISEEYTFDAIVSADAFENLKPAPDIFLAASKNLNVPESECIVIEDALAGVQAAKAARMRCIAVTTTLSEDKLQQAGPSLIRKQIGNVSIDDVLYGGQHSLDQSV
ncbi:hypothetical protein ZIOFF_060765 [Zingiber officinale]|uniref:Uncharacterized protein n=1 Tax=Zingiber officinale TaxID=94328 RepID=A0A8J5F6S5_ZINOF|nr:hypothetical protein ZIOFF_060765 [Zingiber officinale]